MTDEEKKFQENVLRVVGNAIVLLDISLFPGKHATGLAEVRGFLESIANDAKAKLEPKVIPPPELTPAA